MKRQLSIILIAIAGFYFSVSAQQKYIDLFNGKDLSGWYIFLKEKGVNNDPNGVFTVKDGNIVISGEEFGCITTEDEFENYKLTVEFKWGKRTFYPREDRARDSGILLHSVGEVGASDGTWMHSIECQLIEGGTGDIIVVGDGSEDFAITATVSGKTTQGSHYFQPDGEPLTFNGGRINWYGRDPEWKDVKGFRGANDLEKPLGEWNLIECYVNGDELLIYLNGNLLNRAYNVKPSKGKIQIQSEGAELFVRKVHLTRLN